MKLIALVLLMSTQAFAANGWECTLHSAGAFETTNSGTADLKAPFALVYFDFTRNAYTKEAALAALRNICVNAFLQSTSPVDTVRLTGQSPTQMIVDLKANVLNNLAVCGEAVPRLSVCEQVELRDK